MKEKEIPNIYSQAQRFADVTKILIINGNIKRAMRCIRVADDLFRKGNTELKNAISKVYVCSLSHFMEMHSCNIRGLFPKNLRKEYFKQLNTARI